MIALILRLPDNRLTPAKQVLREAERYVNKPNGGQKLTWLELVRRDLEKLKVAAVNSGGGGSRLYNN